MNNARIKVVEKRRSFVIPIQMKLNI